MKKKPKKWGSHGMNLSHCKFKILKAYLLLTLTFILQASASINSQVLKVDLNVTNTELRTVIDVIENQCDYKFFFNEGDVNIFRKLNLKLENADIDEIVVKVFGNNYEYRISGRIIVISIKNEVFKNDTKIKVQRMIKGNISDSFGTPLPGVNVVLIGSNKGVTSDFDGNYIIEADTGDMLEFSYIGMKTMQVSVGVSDIVNVEMEEEKALDEVIVIGYGTQRKKDITGAVVSVTSDDFKAQPMINSTDALQGRASGVFVGATNGAPGGTAKILIRGANSLSGSSNPLVVIDGILGGSIESVNPAEIASIEVLKDASSTSIYGSRGANGVILITTKRGKSSKPTVSFNTFYGMQKVGKKINLLSASDFASEVNALDLAIGGAGDIYSNAEIEDLRQSGGTDWQEEMFRTAATQNYQLSVGGKLNNTDYYFSGNYADQEGIIVNTGYKRYNVRANVNSQISDKVKMGLNLAVMNTQGKNNQNRSSLGSPVYASLAFDPTMPIFADDGSYNLSSIKGVGTLGINPLAQQLEFNVDRENTRVTFNAYIDYEIIQGLTLNVSGGSIVSLSSDKRFNAELNTENTASIFNGDFRLNQITSRLTYEKEIDDHRFKIDVIYEIQDSKFSTSNISATDIAYPATTFNNIGSSNSSIVSSFAEEKKIESFIGRVNYSFKNKYIITGTIRRDGASVLAKGNKYDIFPSGAFAWRMSQEDFMKDSDVFSEVKLRVSYGLTGNQAISPFQSFATLATGATENFPFDDSVGVIGAGPSRLENKNLGWEKTAQFDIGADVAFFEGRLGVVLDYYKKNTSDLLMAVPTAPFRGGLLFTDNIGSIENTGFEIGVSANIVSGNKFQWNANLNMAKNETIVTDLGGEEVFFAGDKFGDGQAVAPAVILEVGKRTGNFYGFIYDGVWKTSEAADAAVFGNVPGDAKYRDINGDGVINSDDLGVIGNGQPKLVWGFNNTFTFMNFDLNLFLQGVQGNEIWNLGKGYIFGGTGDARNATTVGIRNRWTPQNENTNVPGYSSTSINQIQSSRYIEDGSFVRLKNISLGYNVPETVLEKSNIFQSFRVYLSGQNLLTFTNYSGFDPEVSNTGNSSIDQSIDNGAYPTSKSFILGLNVTF